MPHVDGVEHRDVDLGGLRLHVAEAGSGEPLVLVHGWPQHWFQWRKLIPSLAERYRVICPDLRGFGWSDAPPGRYEKKTLARDLVRLLDVLRLERVRLVGHDWGGFVGFLACLRAPERFERFAALSIVSPWYRAPISPLLLAGLAYQGPLVAPVVGPRIAAMPSFTRLVLQLGGERTFARDQLAAYSERFRDPARALATTRLYRSFQWLEMPAMRFGRYVEGRMTVPTLGIYGEKDVLISDDSFESARPHTDSLRIESVPGAAHFITEEAPDEVLNLLLPFLATSD
jgi:pimeloyl-ACP methyl ester carboxylesterase